MSPDERSDLLDAFRRSAFFGALDDAVLDAIADRASVEHVPAGTVVMREGDDSDGMFLVVAGRLRAFVDTDGEQRAVGDVATGETVGEMGLVSDRLRSATVLAVRDSVLARLARADLERLAESDPRTMFGVTRLLVQRLEDAIHQRKRVAEAKLLALAPAGGSAVHRDMAMQLAAALSAERDVAMVTADDWAGGEEGEWAARLQRAERQHDVVLLVTDDRPTAWASFCVRQADRTLVVGEAGQDHRSNALEEDLTATDRVDVIVFGEPRPAETSAWLAARRARRHHHVRGGAGVQRLARVLSGRAVHLVLSGGGARGLAHLGVLKAMREFDFPVDVVGGTSFGAVVGAGWAQSEDLEWLTQGLRRTLVDAGSLLDFTYPSISIAAGERLGGRLEALYGDALIEDGLLDFFCVASNLSAGQMLILDRGPAAVATRASVSIPGIFPPVKTETGDVLVDGGIINNLPIDVMAERSEGGPIIGVNLKGEAALPSADLNADGTTSGWRLAARRHAPWAQDPEVPHLSDVLLRSTELGSVLSTATAERMADLVIRPDVSAYSLLDFTPFDEILSVGYEAACRALEAFLAED